MPRGISDRGLEVSKNAQSWQSTRKRKSGATLKLARIAVVIFATFYALNVHVLGPPKYVLLSATTFDPNIVYRRCRCRNENADYTSPTLVQQTHAIYITKFCASLVD